MVPNENTIVSLTNLDTIIDKLIGYQSRPRYYHGQNDRLWISSHNFQGKANVVFFYYLTYWVKRCKCAPTPIRGGPNDKFWSSASLSLLRQKP